MKVLVALVALAAVIAVQAADENTSKDETVIAELKEKYKGYHRDCAKESGVDKDILTKVKKGEFTDDAKLKDQLFCVNKKSGFQNEAGDLQKDVMLAKINVHLKDAEATEKLVEKCAIKKETPQITAYEISKCFHENSPKKVTLE